jgi:hypothetical protein
MKVNQEAIKLDQLSLLKNLGQLPNGTKNLSAVLIQKELQQHSNNLKNTSVTDGLKTILTELFENTKSDKILLNIAKNSSIFKTFEQFGNEAKKLVELLQNQNTKGVDLSSLKSLFLNIENFDEKKLKTLIEKSIFSSETKALLASLSESDDKEVQKQANKMITQIEYFQLNSYLNNSLYTYLPFDWESFEGGDIEFKKEGSNQYTCHIHLELKEYGNIKINLLYDEQNHISIGFFLENDELKEKMSNNLQSLRISLKAVGVNVQNISLIDAKEKDNDERLNCFEEINNTQTIGLDLTV